MFVNTSNWCFRKGFCKIAEKHYKKGECQKKKRKCHFSKTKMIFK